MTAKRNRIITRKRNWEKRLGRMSAKSDKENDWKSDWEKNWEE